MASLSSDLNHDICCHTRHIFHEIHEIEKQLKKLTKIHYKIKTYIDQIAGSNDTVRVILDIEEENEEEEEI